MTLFPIFLLFLILLFSSFEQSVSISSGSQRVIFRSIINENSKDGDFAIDLNATNFDSVLKETPAPFAIVEFFAHWCPACRNYKPQYEKVARLFNGADASYPGIILMTRVDCASTINSKLCDKFSVDRYPMLFWGPPKKFVSGGWGPKQEKSEIILIENGRTADVLLGWINKQLGSSYGLDDGKYENEHLQTNTSDPGQIAKAIDDVEEATSTAFSIILDHKMIKPETRASLIKFLQLLVAHHPSRRCRKGSADVLVNFDDLCPSSTMLVNNEEAESCSKNGALGNYQICGKIVPRGYWMYCRGSKNDTRGFSCGLWVLLHSLSVRVEDGESNMAFRSTCDFIHNFFVCEECRQHFYEMCSSVSTPFKKARNFALWLWSAHNKVNKRLIKEEASLGTGDPEFPKAIWPPKQLCSSCYLSPSKTSKENNKIDWDEDEVFKFLVSYYGKELVTLYKDNEQQGGGKTEKIVTEELVASTNAVVVPVGAALAIAVASCAFGALAYIWRSRQKNRKYKYIYSLKNI
ncbi:PREDICTED: sulfhydryl oxidase 2-like isoform X1 [Nicotiana attenuata]|uniref:Sulfhydryl oxidase n=1 Tax=Nicotiana attenuata TaxID=49451 RepID=A0A1J6KI77_NICAT|nr:PREDICTED: sulfhydryl oxidase 2-like isoform X1 [Nicotiana attenuata]XP_019237299.1 PREDICTED: sulfhydryl oxidase 2-like isoform X1 [Nicotiana attenuata]OIT22507.1 sulfhydryl oxidase 2 [Nicotiana attenuata]